MASQLHVTNPRAAAEALARPPTEDHPIEGVAAPRLADGIELIGEFEDSGFKKPPFIARRRDGQVVQMPQMLFCLAEQVDGQAGLEQIAERFSAAVQRKVEADDVKMLIDQQLRPLGIVAPEDGEPVELGKVDPLLALRFRAALVPDRAVRSLTTVFAPLFLPPVVVLAVLGLLGLDGWLFFIHGVSQSLRHTLYQPALMLMLIGGVVLATAFHEIGHATACRYGGAKPGVMGVGIYIVWPAFYTDITDAYRLSKWGRLRTDLGGMYFNGVFALITGGLYAATAFEPLLLLIVLQNFAILQQALPLLRLDGYYILSDLTGVPDIFLRIRPVLSSFIPGRPADERVTELKSWVRGVVSAYVLLIVAFLAVSVLALVINLPRIAATGYDSAALRLQAVGPDFSRGVGVRGVLDVIQVLFLILPAAGLAYTAGRVGRRTASGAIGWSSGRPERQAALGLAGAAAVALAVLSWWPNGEYRPLQRGERGTVGGLFHEVAALPSGRPSLTRQRQRQLGGAPTERQRRSGVPAVPPSPSPAAHKAAAPQSNSGGTGTGTSPAPTPPASTTPAPASQSSSSSSSSGPSTSTPASPPTTGSGPPPTSTTPSGP